MVSKIYDESTVNYENKALDCGGISEPKAKRGNLAKILGWSRKHGPCMTLVTGKR